MSEKFGSFEKKLDKIERYVKIKHQISESEEDEADGENQERQQDNSSSNDDANGDDGQRIPEEKSKESEIQEQAKKERKHFIKVVEDYHTPTSSPSHSQTQEASITYTRKK